MHTRLRSEILALVNRHAWLEERAAASLEIARALREEVAGRIGSVEALAANAHTRVDMVVADHHATAARMTDFEALAANAHTRVDMVVADHHAITPTTEGLFLATAGDSAFLLKSGDFISETVRRDGEWDTHITRVAALAAGTVGARAGSRTALRALDVGGHFGLVSVPLADLFDHVISFEPNVFNAALLRANVLLNGLAGKVEVRREAVGASTGHVSLAPADRQEIPLPLDEHGRFSPRLSSNLGAYSFVQDGTGLSAAPATTLDALGLHDVAFIKVDVQGADGAVLLGGMETIARCRPWLVFEWEEALSQPFGVTFDEVASRLQSAGYTLRVLYRHNQKQVDHLAVPQEEEFVLPASEEAAT